MCGFILGGGIKLGGVTLDDIKWVASGSGVVVTRTGTCAGRFWWSGGGGLGGLLGGL